MRDYATTGGKRQPDAPSGEVIIDINWGRDYNPNGRYMQYRVNQDKCTGCGTCTDVCPTEAIRIEDGKAGITIDCIDCGACTRVCPEGAIKMITATAPASSTR